MSITIAAIIPTHNRLNLLKRAIESVFGQTESVDEIIVVDDANSDEVKIFVDSFNLPNLKYIRNLDKGACSSRNLGVKAAKSNFVAFLDDDDEWMLDKIKIQKNKIIERNLDACFSRVLLKYEDRDIKYSSRSKMPINIKKEILLKNFIGVTISAIVNRDVFEQINGFDTNFPARQDYDLWIRIIYSDAKIDIVEKVLSISYNSFDNRSRISSNLSNLELAIDLLNKKYDSIIKKELTLQEQKKRYIKQIEFLASKAVSIGLRNEAINYYWRILRLKFSFKTITMMIITFINPIILIRIRSIIS